MSYDFLTNALPPKNLVIERYCAIKKREALTQIGGCEKALPLSKKYDNYSSSSSSSSSSSKTNQCSRLRNKMNYAQYVRTYGTTQYSTSAPKKTCSIAGPTFVY